MTVTFPPIAKSTKRRPLFPNSPTSSVTGKKELIFSDLPMARAKHSPGPQIQTYRAYTLKVRGGHLNSRNKAGSGSASPEPFALGEAKRGRELGAGIHL